MWAPGLAWGFWPFGQAVSKRIGEFLLLGRRKVWIGLLVSLFFLALLFYKSNLQEIVFALSQANYLFLVPAIMVYFLGVVFESIRWRYLLSPLKSVTARTLFPITVIGYMANDVLPIRMGELVRAYLLGEKENISKTSILATIVVERMFDGLTLLSFLILVITVVPASSLAPGQGGQFVEWLQGIARIGALFFLGFLVLFLVMASSKNTILRLVGLPLRVLPPRLQVKGLQLTEVFIGGLAVLQSPWKTVLVFTMSVLAWLAEAGMYFFVMLGFSFIKPYYVMMLVTSTANLATTVPSSQGGVGPFEYFTVQTLALAGVNLEIASAYAIVLHAALLIPVTLLGFFYLWRQDLSLWDISGGRIAVLTDDKTQV